MKKYLGLVLCALLVALFGAAVAETVQPLPLSLVKYDLPDEAEDHASIHISGSHVTIDLNTSAIDWQAMFLRNPDRNPAVNWWITPPEGYGLGDYALWQLLSWDDARNMPSDEKLLSLVQENIRVGKYYQIHKIRENGSIESNDVPFTQPPFTEESVNFGEYLQAVELAQPYHNDLSVIIGWYKEVEENGQKVKKLYNDTFYRFDLTINHSNLDAIRVRNRPLIPAEQMQDYWNETDENGKLKPKPYTVTFERGKVTYRFTEKLDFYAGDVLITPPEGAVSFSWDDYNGGMISPLVQKETNGPKYAEIRVTARSNGAAQINQADVLHFYDASGDEIQVMRCSYSVYPAENEFWPYYQPGYQAFPDASVSIVNTAAGAGVKHTYNPETGELNINWGEIRDGVTTSALEGQIMLKVNAPEGYNYYKAWWRGSGGMRGNLSHTTGNREWPQLVAKEMIQTGSEAIPVQSIHDEVPYMNIDAFRKVTPEDNNKISVYVPCADGEDLLIGMIVYWFKNPVDAETWYQTEETDDDPIRQFLWETHSGGMESVFVMPIESLEVIKGNPHYGTHPMFKGPHGHEDEWMKWQLMVTTYYQVGTNSRHYELKLVDENGLPVDPKYKVTIYLPYRDGLTYEIATSKHFELRHYTEQLYAVENANLTGNQVTVIPTEYGLMYETDSFSPFIVSWEDEVPAAPIVPAPPANIPQTGDNTPVALLTALLILSAALLLRKKKTC